MGAYRDENKNGTWYCKFSYVNWKGEKLNKKKKRIFNKEGSVELGKRVSITASRNG
ncbi:hypothetical protein HMPREF0080_01090 [Anaeroglobus geminatus F0357]|uniref:AP2-like integrase N-terminal domain-containing protein n=1 Tax=Anaeroglobus geminatus F0357 TaxID=861450 RepID=G9YHF9_9FIRM|nr:hypothetical protein [Anaeroglobus geminatus]EHM40829.1 hypothetical protein HMPREF0080_01090 [Anaeroglobus geminatus F0357]